MPTNRFGNVNTTPLYNATGRINRGEAPQVAPFSPANAGTQRDWSAMRRPRQAQSPFPDAFENISQMNRRYGDNPTTGGGGGGTSGGGFPSAEEVKTMLSGLGDITVTNNFAGQDSSKNYGIGDRSRVHDNPQQQQQGASGAGGVTNNFGRQDSSKNYGDMGGEPAKPAKKPRAPRTEEQKAETARKRAEKKAENPAYGTRNPNRTKAAPKPKKTTTKPSKTGSVYNDSSINSNFQGNNNDFGSDSPGGGFFSGSAGNIEGMAISTAGNAQNRR